MTGRSGITLTVVYDNNQYDQRLRTDWGFSCLIQRGDVVLLFDTGGNGGILLSNMSQLGLDGVEIDHVVLSHVHGDHTGGLSALLARGIQPVVWVPRSFPAALKERLRSTTEIREVSSPVTVAEGIHSTGELGSAMIEQSLVLESDRGLVVITGCAHPGIVEIVARVKELYPGELYLVLGGFHLGGKSHAEVEQIASQLKELGVQKLAPCHCTGADPTRWLAEEWGADFQSCGVGRVIEVPL
jgi:7,8-dihydropterin-6-yl-methyl-4-(beta-D-ribofuranosyl)aminobenzene 5'-phosphate synthase